MARSVKLTRGLDRYLGIPALFLLGSFRPAARLPAYPQRIAVFVFGAIGDTIVASATFSDLRTRYPDARITVFATKENEAVLSLVKGYDQAVALPIYKPFASLSLIRRERFDILIDFNQWIRISALYAALSGARCTVGFRTRGQHRHFSYDRSVAHSASVHEVENYRKLVLACGICSASLPNIQLEDRSSVTERLPERYIVFHPWAAGENGWRKEWPLERWVAVGKRLAEYKLPILITGSRLDSERSAHLTALARDAGVMMTSLAGQTTLQQTAAVFAGAEVVISVNTGTMHLAAAVGAPLISLHGPVSPRRWGPLTSRNVNIEPPAGLGGYLYLGFEYPRNNDGCMELIEVEEVAVAARRIVAERIAPVQQPREL